VHDPPLASHSLGQGILCADPGQQTLEELYAKILSTFFDWIDFVCNRIGDARVSQGRPGLRLRL
jgi:hypothetical protein